MERLVQEHHGSVPPFDALAELDVPGEELTAPGPCALCDRDPALGFASIDGEWYCHGDWQPDPTCYMLGQRRSSRGQGRKSRGVT